VKILHVTPFYEPCWAYGGMVRASAGLCRALVRRGLEVTVATAQLSPSDLAEETLGGVRVHRFPGPALLRRWLIPWGHGLRAFLQAQRPSFDLVHVHGHRNGLAAAAAATLAASGRRWVVSTHGTFPRHGQLSVVKAILDRAAFARVVEEAAAVIAVSDSEARDLPQPSHVIPNGVEAPGDARRTRGADRPRVLFVGTDRPQKRGALLPAILEALPDSDLHLVGSFGRAFLRRLAGMGEQLTVRGVLAGDALAAAYADADVVLHPAVGEAFGLVPFEAALAGAAAVVAGGHGCGEWYGRAGGCVVAPDDVEAFRQAIRVRLSDRGLARAEAEAVAAFTRRSLTWDQAAQATESLYRDVIAA
jgi:glycosyltransferase involved in cell wall biosynthesis